MQIISKVFKSKYFKIVESYQAQSQYQQNFYQFATIKRTPKQQEENQNQKIKGSALFQSYYHPLKKIDFSNGKEFHKIYESKTLINRDYNKVKVAGMYWAPFGIYLSNFIFFFDFAYLPHYIALGGLFLFGSVKSMSKLIMANQRIAEMWISHDGQQFLVAQRYSMYFEKMNENFELENSKIINLERMQYSFGIDDIQEIYLIEEQIKLQEQQEKKEQELKSKKEDSQKENANKQEQEEQSKKTRFQGFRITQQQQKDTLFVQFQKSNYEEPRQIYIDIDKNELQAYNDYLIALGNKKKLAMTIQEEKQEN